MLPNVKKLNRANRANQSRRQVNRDTAGRIAGFGIGRDFAQAHSGLRLLRLPLD